MIRSKVHKSIFFQICDSDCVILDVNASYGGATHDAFIWSQCDVKRHLESLTDTAYLLGKYK